MNTDEPISMYVPARNAERTLAACIEAIGTQTRPPDELFVIVDTRSTDRTVDVASGAGVRVVEQKGSTLGAARNEAILAASHRWLACCDSDVVIEPDWLERLADWRDSGVVGIGGRTNERTRNPFDEWRALHMPHHWGDYPMRNPFMLVSEVLFDRQALLAVGGYRDDLNYYEDSDLCQRLREAGFDLLYEPSAVATHQRSDTLAGLLALRWQYSEYRQKHQMDRYAGLIDKTDVNREYALNTLARSLARRREDLSYISLLLYFHHLLMDLRSLLSRRPLIPAATRGWYERTLVELAATTLAERHGELAQCVSTDLRELTSPRRGPAPHPPAPKGWSSYLDAVRSAITSFCDELSPGLLSTIEKSGRYVHGRIGRDGFLIPPVASTDRLQAALETVPIQPFVNEDFCRSVRQRWPDLSTIRTIGPLTENERAIVGQVNNAGTGNGSRDVALAAHLETRPDPLSVFSTVDANETSLIACYCPPTRFVPGLDVPSASDLASSAAAAGWSIAQFDTLVGRTRLMLTR